MSVYQQVNEQQHASLTDQWQLPVRQNNGAGEAWHWSGWQVTTEYRLSLEDTASTSYSYGYCPWFPANSLFATAAEALSWLPVVRPTALCDLSFDHEYSFVMEFKQFLICE